MRIVLKALNLIVCLFIFGILSLPLHEGGHSLAAQCFGVSGYIELDWFALSGTFILAYDLATWQMVIIAFAGGGFTALMLGLLLVFAHVGKKWDESDLTPLRMVLGMQLGYGLAEISLVIALKWFALLAPIGFILGIVIAFIYSFPRLIKWWVQ